MPARVQLVRVKLAFDKKITPPFSALLPLKVEFSISRSTEEELREMAPPLDRLLPLMTLFSEKVQRVMFVS